MSRHYGSCYSLDMGKATAVYCRISKDSKEGAGLGVKRQESDCRDLARANGWHNIHVYADNDVSAYSGKLRPQYQAMLAAMRAGEIERVIAWHTDRLHRSPVELEEYIAASEGHDIPTVTVKSGLLDLATPSGRLVARQLGSVARYESEHKSERIVRKKLELATDGKFGGGPIPFGYRRDENGRIAIEPEQADEIRKAFRTIIAGGSIGSIFKDLNTRGIPTNRGGKWTSTAVRNMVVRPTYAGLAVYRGQVLGKSEFPAIVSEDEWRTAARIIKDPSRRSQFDSRVKHLLGGLILCSCGTPMKTSSRGGDRGPNRFYYKCTRTGGGHAFQTAAPLEEYIAAVVVSRLQQPDALTMLGAPAEREERDRMAELQQEALTLRARLEEAAESHADGSITIKQLETITARVQARLDEVETGMSHARGSGILAGVPAEEIPQWWGSATVEQQRAVIDSLMEIHIDPIRKAAPRTFDPSRVRISWRATPGVSA